MIASQITTTTKCHPQDPISTSTKLKERTHSKNKIYLYRPTQNYAVELNARFQVCIEIEPFSL